MKALPACLLISIIGIFILIILAGSEPKQNSIKELNSSFVNQKVKISGEVVKISDKITFQILSVQDSTGKIEVLCKCKNKSIKINQLVVVLGKISEYRNKKQINADKIISNYQHLR